MRRDANTYVFKDYGADYFKDFDFEFELEITAGDTQGNALLCAVSNFPSGGFQNLRNNNDCIGVWAYNNANDLRIYLSDYNTDNDDFYVDGGSTSNRLFCTFKRVGTTATLDIYSDSGRTSLV
jgi:hypothetical protein